MKINITISSIIILIIITQTGCYTTEEKFRAAERKDTISAYQEFIRRYPQGEYKDKAEKRIAALEFRAAEEKDKIAAHEAFIKRYQAYKAEKRIAALEFRAAERKDTISAYQEFIRRYPQGEYKDKAEKRIAALEFRAAEKKDTISAYQEFIRRHPDSLYVEELQEKISRLFEHRGPGSRFVIPVDISDGHQSHIKFKGNSITGAHFLYEMFGLALSAGNGSIFEFIGKIDFETDEVYIDNSRLSWPPGIVGLVIDGTVLDTLKFILVRPHGLIYLSGKGQVTLPNGKIVSLQ